MEKSVFFVLLEGKAYSDSVTLKSMMRRTFRDVDLVIINRGPSALTFDKAFIHTLGLYVRSISIRELIETRLMSEVFATLITSCPLCKRYVFLDDDIVLNKHYLRNLDKIYRNDIELQMHPQRGIIIYPNLLARYAQRERTLFTCGLGLTERDRSFNSIEANKLNRDIVMQEVSYQKSRFILGKFFKKSLWLILKKTMND